MQHQTNFTKEIELCFDIVIYTKDTENFIAHKKGRSYAISLCDPLDSFGDAHLVGYLSFNC